MVRIRLLSHRKSPEIRLFLSGLKRRQSRPQQAESSRRACYFLFLTGSHAATPRQRVARRAQFRALPASPTLVATEGLHTLHTLPVY
jgi:hypothetical protein